MPSFSLRVNGLLKTVEVPSDTPLLWVLRDSLALTGTKYGCGAGICGACSVDMNGTLTRSCITSISRAAGQEITTIEGLGTSRLHPLQKAWIQEDVPQCGYCQSGQLMAAAALLKKMPHPSDAQITEFMSANLCRCGTYERIRRAIHRAAGGAE